MFIPPSIRVAFKVIVIQRRPHLVSQRHQLEARHFSQSRPRQAAEDRDSVLAQLQASPIMTKIADKPEALKALHDFAQVLKEANVDLSPGKPPSTMQMFKLAANPQFREGAKKVVLELRNAGIDINSENAFELFGMKAPVR